METTRHRYRYALVTQRENVKAVKSALQEKGVFGRSVQPLVVGGDVRGGDGGVVTTPKTTNDEGDRFLLHTTVLIRSPAPDEESDEPSTVLADLPPDLKDIPNVLYALAIPVDSTSVPGNGSKPSSLLTPSEPASPVYAALSRYLHSHPPTSAGGISTSVEELLSTAPKRYSYYPPLLLLPTGTFASEEWKAYIKHNPEILESLSKAVQGVTHVAVNAPIHVSSIVRSPDRLWKLYPPEWALSKHSGVQDDGKIDFDEALWVQTTQSSIPQTWPPEHVMFSRGNITEKARILNLPKRDVAGKEVADLYAGIGYFVFSYVKAGAKRVWAWEVNPWSVESLKRGCALNGWACRVVGMGEKWMDVAEEIDGKGKEDEVKVVVFHESNEKAVTRVREIEELRDKKEGLLKMAHVNLGYLPSSRMSWGSAVELVDKLGGVVHVHENVAEAGIEDKAEEVVMEMTRIWAELDDETRDCKVKCEKIVKVKTFAPGVWHVVYDVRFGELEG
ncbi:hypothetical protein EX30DRAFT_363214 [Ascodesmis nigricans]|uniref:tRNA(Phe) (4-demethylwyosine(37)-C(7)) aminocarboxypropyltransferase n=1 Tax=Ascodesmis nigricans TaxID=341454 RepID=A0A4S2MZM0_9PEZI|nr:hypothetical protein EX30DRAFT_363214 [Ascodesmis nigricans]